MVHPGGRLSLRARMVLAIVLAALSVGVVVAPRVGAAQPARTTQGWFLRNSLAVRLNPLGLFDEFRAGYRHRLFPSDDSMFQNTFVALGTNISISPAFGRGGIAFEFQPLSILNLSAVYEAGGYFSSFGLAQSFQSAQTANFSDAEIARLRDLPAGSAGRNYATWLHQLQLGILFQIRFGPVIFRTNNRFVYQSIGIRTGDRVFYDQYWDILFPNNGWIYVNDVDLILEPVTNFKIGLRWNVTHPFYTSEHLAPAEQFNRPAVQDTHRLGPLFAYTFFERRHGSFNAPTIAIVVNWYLQHEYRTGVPGGAMAPSPNPYISQAIPYVAALFSFRFDP